MNLPNKITLLRIALTFVFMFFLFSTWALGKMLALVTFLAAAFTDYLDGYFAKKYDQISNFGKIMDPVADKILTIAAFLAFVEMKLVPAWMVVIIVLRELVITSIRIGALRHKEILQAEMAGKQKTFSQMFSILVILIFIMLKETSIRAFDFWNPALEYWYRQIIFILMLVTVALTVISGISYMVNNKRIFSE